MGCHHLVAHHLRDVIGHLILLFYSHVLLLVHKNMGFLPLRALIYRNLVHLNLLLGCIFEHCHLLAIVLTSSNHLDGVLGRCGRTAGYIQRLTVIKDLNRVGVMELDYV